MRIAPHVWRETQRVRARQWQSAGLRGLDVARVERSMVAYAIAVHSVIDCFSIKSLIDD
jgi:hypothetical protein